MPPKVPTATEGQPENWTAGQPSNWIRTGRPASMSGTSLPEIQSSTARLSVSGISETRGSPALTSSAPGAANRRNTVPARGAVISWVLCCAMRVSKETSRSLSAATEPCADSR